jgi:hypothetical protein
VTGGGGPRAAAPLIAGGQLLPAVPRPPRPLNSSFTLWPAPRAPAIGSPSADAEPSNPTEAAVTSWRPRAAAPLRPWPRATPAPTGVGGGRGGGGGGGEGRPTTTSLRRTTGNAPAKHERAKPPGQAPTLQSRARGARNLASHVVTSGPSAVARHASSLAVCPPASAARTSCSSGASDGTWGKRVVGGRVGRGLVGRNQVRWRAPAWAASQRSEVPSCPWLKPAPGQTHLVRVKLPDARHVQRHADLAGLGVHAEGRLGAGGGAQVVSAAPWNPPNPSTVVGTRTKSNTKPQYSPTLISPPP